MVSCLLLHTQSFSMSHLNYPPIFVFCPSYLPSQSYSSSLMYQTIFAFDVFFTIKCTSLIWFSTLPLAYYNLLSNGFPLSTL